ncbi:uncharacterized protein [Watersipora subatra]
MSMPNVQKASPVLFRQLFEHKSYTYTYLLACMKTKEAVIIDPVIEMVPRDMRILEQLGLALKYAINTHVHADHITGSGKLKAKLPGSASILGVDSGAKADMYIGQGEKVCFGDVELEARKTPGHTNGCMSFVWHDQKCVFSGDAVLIRGCGRTDFQQGNADTLYKSVHTQIFSLPDDYVIYPAHDYTGQPWTTVGEEKQFNPRLSKTKEEFIELMNNLNLPYPKQIDRALPANLLCGIVDVPTEAET